MTINPFDAVRNPERLAALARTRLLDTPAEPAFDRLTCLASRLLVVPIALVSFVDQQRQFFKSSAGLPEPWAGLRQAQLSYTFCPQVATASSGEEALELIEHNQSDVIVMDMLMPGIGGVETTRLIKQRQPRVQVIALTSSQDGALVKQALQAGAISYLLKNVSALDLAQAIRAAHAGRSTLAPEATAVLVHSVRAPRELGDDLSEREREVLQLAVQGLSNMRIAEQLSISRSTVKFHLSSIFSKLGVSSRPELIALAYQHHLV